MKLGSAGLVELRLDDRDKPEALEESNFHGISDFQELHSINSNLFNSRKFGAQPP